MEGGEAPKPQINTSEQQPPDNHAARVQAFGKLKSRYSKVRPFVKETMGQMRNTDEYKNPEIRKATQKGAFKTAENMYPLVMRDKLTGLFNRRFFDDNADNILAGERRAGRKTAIFMLDLDGMKPVNDKYGHEKGDELLKGTASLIQRAVRRSDLVIRLGGDEFVVIAINVKDEETPEKGANMIGEKIRETIYKNLPRNIELNSEQGNLSSSIGYIEDNGKLSAADLLAKADAAMYDAKHPQDGSKGKNRVVPYREGMVNPERISPEQINR